MSFADARRVPTVRRSVASIIPLALASIGAAVPLIGSGYTTWGLAVVWLTAVGVILVGPVIARIHRPTRVFIDLIALVAILLMFAPLGGWWFVPAVDAQLALDVDRARRTAADRVKLADPS